MATFKKYNYNAMLVGTGAYKFRPYTVLSATVPLSTTLTNCSLVSTQKAVNRVGRTSLTFQADENYRLPTSAQVTGATAVSWNQDTGVLVVEKPTIGEVNVKIVATRIVYSIDETLANVERTSGTSYIDSGGTTTLTYTASENYELPDAVTVTGADYQWSQDVGTLVLRNPTGNVSVGISGVYLLKIIETGSYFVNDEPAVSTTHAQFDFTTNNAHSAGISITNAGIVYDFDAPMGKTQVYTASTKSWTLPAYKNIKLDFEAHVSEAFFTWWSANATMQLPTPQNVIADDTVVSFDTSEGAEIYDVRADGFSIGTTGGES